MSGLVSVVLTTFNRPNLLARALRSVVNQSYENWECLVIDDASEKPVGHIVDSFDDERIMYHRHEKNHGLSAARNTGLQIASGSMVAFFDDDDEWLDTKLEKQVRCLEQADPGVALVYCWMQVVKEGEIFDTRCPKLRGDIFQHTLDRQPLGNGSTWLLRRSAVLEEGGFDESLDRGIDGDLLRRLCRTYKVDYVADCLVRYHIGHGNERITRSDREGLENALAGKSKKLEKFKKELDIYSKKKSNIISNMGVVYSKMGKNSEAIKMIFKSANGNPFSKRFFVNAGMISINIIKNLLTKWTT